MTAPRCAQWMPKAKALCGRPLNHQGVHKSQASLDRVVRKGNPWGRTASGVEYHRTLMRRVRAVEPTPGVVYFATCIDTAGVVFVKIGAAKRERVVKRMRELQNGNPFKVSLHATLESDDVFTTERQLQRRFQNCQVHWEWFKLSLELAEFIRKEAMLSDCGC